MFKKILVLWTVTFFFLVNFEQALGGESERVTILVGRTREKLEPIVANPPVLLGYAVASIFGGTDERDAILLVRNGKFYALSSIDYHRGGRRIELNGGDEVSLLGTNNSLEAFRKEHPSVIIGLEAVRKALGE